MSKLHERIKELLAASAPCTLVEILAEVLTQTDIPRQKVLPRVIQALADLTATGEIKEWEQMPLENALEYAWELGDDEEAENDDPLDDGDVTYDAMRDDELTD
jgi:hypothetical protein